jgi:hypothetical protein
VQRQQILEHPFPHLHLEGVLEIRFYRQLASEFPSLATLLCGRQPQSNGQCFCTASSVLGNPAVSGSWQQFFRYHTSGAFYAEIVSLFGHIIEDLHPTLCRSVGKPLKDFKTSVRNVEPMADIALDCQFVYNPPSDRATCVRGPHLDRPVALYAGLLYFRLEGDATPGGDLDLYQCAGAPSAGTDGAVDPELIRKIKTIPYQPNAFVLFPHSRVSVHGVSIRHASPLRRLHINLLGEFAAPLF